MGRDLAWLALWPSWCDAESLRLSAGLISHRTPLPGSGRGAIRLDSAGPLAQSSPKQRHSLRNTGFRLFRLCFGGVGHSDNTTSGVLLDRQLSRHSETQAFAYAVFHSQASRRVAKRCSAP